MNAVKEQTLIEALDLLEQGLSVDEVVNRFPSDEAGLRPFLITALTLSELATQPTIAAEQMSKTNFLANAEAMSTLPKMQTRGWLPRVLAPIFAALAIFFLGGLALVNASGSAIPGDALYETKLAYEEFRLAWTSDPERAATLRGEYRQRRLQEITALLDAGREEDVTFEGGIEVMNSDGRWTVAGIPVLVNQMTVIEGQPATGALIRVNGRTAGGTVEAEQIVVLNSSLELPAMLETPTPPTVITPTVTVPPSPTSTTTVPPSPMPTNTGDTQQGGAPIQVPAATIEATPPPTQPEPLPTTAPLPPTAVPDDDDDDNDDPGDDGDDGDSDGDDDNDDDAEGDDDNNDDDDVDSDDDGSDDDD